MNLLAIEKPLGFILTALFAVICINIISHGAVANHSVVYYFFYNPSAAHLLTNSTNLTRMSL